MLNSSTIRLLAVESAKLHVLDALVPYVRPALRALVPSVPRALLTLVPDLLCVLHAFEPHMLRVIRALLSNVPLTLRVLVPHVFSCPYVSLLHCVLHVLISGFLFLFSQVTFSLSFPTR